MKKLAVLGLAAICIFATAARGDEAKTKRILILGDSWTTALTAENRDPIPSQNLLSDFLAEKGFPDAGTQGAMTAWGGRRASHWAQPANLATIVSELETYPTIDIVHLIIGGNDLLGKALDGTLSVATETQRQAIWDGVVADIRTIVETALGVRDDIRVLLCDYDYLNMAQAETFWGMNFHGATNQQLNEWFVELGQKKLELSQEIPRMEYVQNWGTLQYWFGDPAQAVPYPGQAPDFEPYPGGDPALPMPEQLSPDGIHPNIDAHRKMLDNAFNAFYGAWLSEAEEDEDSENGMDYSEMTSLQLPAFRCCPH